MRFWAFFTDVLYDLKFLEALDKPRAEQKANKKSGEARVGRSERHVLNDVERLQWRQVRVHRIKELVQQVIEHYASTLEKVRRSAFNASSSFTPRDPLIRTTSPARTSRSRILPASSAFGANRTRSSATPASRAPSRRDCASPCTPTISETPAAAASFPHDRCRSAADGPSSSISPATTIFRL